VNNNVVELHPKARKSKRGFKKFLSRNFMFIVIFFFAGYIVYGIGAPMLQTKELSSEVASVEKEIALAKKQNQELQEKIDLLKTNEYVERVAREKLGFVKPGEILIMPAEIGDLKELNKETPLY